MYTYKSVFVGIPLSQYDDAPEWLDALKDYVSDYAMRNFTPDTDILQDYAEITDPQAQAFLLWICANQAALLDLGFDFHSSYHGGDDYPLIFGRYVDEWFPIPEFGAAPMRFDGLEHIHALCAKARALFATVPESIAQDMDRLVTVWFNDHSS